MWLGNDSESGFFEALLSMWLVIYDVEGFWGPTHIQTLDPITLALVFHLRIVFSISFLKPLFYMSYVRTLALSSIITNTWIVL